MQVIAEAKTHSPFGWQSDKSWSELFAMANEVGDIISIHTDPRWQGSFDLVRKARSLTTKPILAKGIHASDDDIKQALVAGADHVLVVGRIPAIHLDKCLIEPYTIAELTRLPGQCRAVWNSRDLATGGIKKEQFEEARRIFSGWLCQASNIKDIKDVHEGADAALVGTHLVEYAESTRNV